MNKEKTATSYERKMTIAAGVITVAWIVFLISMIMTCNPARAQEAKNDSVSLMMITPEQAIGFMSKNFRIAHDEFRAGWITAAAGSSVIAASTLIESSASGTKQLTAIVGSVGLITGAILMIDSHAKIGNCGRVYLSPVGLTLKISK